LGLAGQAETGAGERTMGRGGVTGPVLRLLADRVYVCLGRWLRAAGHDTAIAASRRLPRS